MLIATLMPQIVSKPPNFICQSRGKRNKCFL